MKDKLTYKKIQIKENTIQQESDKNIYQRAENANSKSRNHPIHRH
jgi:hypothetical protein